MYSKQQASLVRQQFYTSLGLYMAPVLSAEGGKQNWLNYKTGVRHIFIRTDTPSRDASIGLLLTHPDPATRLEQFEQFLVLRPLLQHTDEIRWIWQKEALNQTEQPISRIYAEFKGGSVLNKADWPALISFFKPRLIALDAFWSQVKFQFEP